MNEKRKNEIMNGRNKELMTKWKNEWETIEEERINESVNGRKTEQWLKEKEWMK